MLAKGVRHWQTGPLKLSADWTKHYGRCKTRGSEEGRLHDLWLWLNITTFSRWRAAPCCVPCNLIACAVVTVRLMETFSNSAKANCEDRDLEVAYEGVCTHDLNLLALRWTSKWPPICHTMEGPAPKPTHLDSLHYHATSSSTGFPYVTQWSNDAIWTKLLMMMQVN